MRIRPVIKPPWAEKKEDAAVTELPPEDDVAEPAGSSGTSSALSREQLKALRVQRGWPHFKDVFMLSSVEKEDVETLKVVHTLAFHTLLLSLSLQVHKSRIETASHIETGGHFCRLNSDKSREIQGLRCWLKPQLGLHVLLHVFVWVLCCFSSSSCRSLACCGNSELFQRMNKCCCLTIHQPPSSPADCQHSHKHRIGKQAKSENGWMNIQYGLYFSFYFLSPHGFAFYHNYRFFFFFYVVTVELLPVCG